MKLRGSLNHWDKRLPGEADIGQHIIPINKPVPQNIVFFEKNGFKYADKKIYIIYSSQEAFYPNGEENPSTSFVGYITIFFM